MTSPHAIAPVTRGDLVAAVLARDPALVDVFIRHSPHFEKLRNPVLRRTMGRLVTVEQAAGVAGVTADALIRDLNEALGIRVTTEAVDIATAANQLPETPVGAIRAAKRPSSLREVELDLRDDLRRGIEPFARIMAAVGALRETELLHLRTIFEPVPLYTVLGRRGLHHDARQHAKDDWSVWFWHGDAAPSPASVATETGRPAALASGQPAAGEQWLDVRGLEPPEPMVRTLAALESLGAGETLVQVNVRVPQFLLPVLAERGFAADVDESEPDRVLVRIRRA